jgi:hypothetical protein
MARTNSFTLRKLSGGKDACMTITPSLFEAYLKCPTKCFLRSLGETSTGNECADFDRAQQTSYETQGIKRLTQTLATNACVAGDSIALTGKRAQWRVAIGPRMVKNLKRIEKAWFPVS